MRAHRKASQEGPQRSVYGSDRRIHCRRRGAYVCPAVSARVHTRSVREASGGPALLRSHARTDFREVHGEPSGSRGQGKRQPREYL